ncbi:MAG: phage portal protein [Anaerotignum sp.]|nr:phage portal protein [Anaerotignum sp.]
MGWLNGILKKLNRNTTYAQMLNGYTPVFSQFGDNIFASDVVQQAISCIVTEMKKLNPQHVRENGGDAVPVNGDRQKVLLNPNPLMTKSDFLEKITWSLMLHYNAFVIPVYDVWRDEAGREQRNYRALYPVQPASVEFMEDAAGKLFVKLRFANTYETALPYDDVIHLKYRFSVNEFMGGNQNGMPDYGALLKTLQVNEDLMTGVGAAMKSSFSINGVVKYNTLMDDGKTETALKDLESKLLQNRSGFLPLDLKADFIPIKKDVKMVDADTLKFLDEKILRHFGVSLPILTGDYTPAQYEAFYQKTLEPVIIGWSDEFSRVLFSERERAFGNRIRFYPKDLIFMSIDQTLEMVRLLGDSGSLYENEKRVAFGLRPLPELEGVRMQSLNYVNVEIAAKYQIGRQQEAAPGSTGGGTGKQRG